MSIRSAMLTAAEEWKVEGIVEGRVEGRMEAKIEVVENLLKLNMDWRVIEQATGINQSRFHELKRLFAMTNLDQHQSLPPKPSATNQAPMN